MYVRLTKSKKSKHPTLQIVQGIREGKKVKQKIIASLGVIKSKKDLEKAGKLAEHLVRQLEKEGIPIDKKLCIKDLVHRKTVYDGFGVVVDKIMELTDFSNVIHQAQGKQRFDLENVIKLMIVQRLELPGSKLRTYERQHDHGFENISLHQIYRAMDAIGPFSAEIQKHAFQTVQKFSEDTIDCFFFDVTTLYFESVIQDDLKNFGFSKDQKHHSVQIVLALVVDSKGMPLAYEVFQGNLAETKTLIPVLETLRNRFSIKNVTVVCDRGLASISNVKALQEAKFHFVIASKLRSMSKNLKINDLTFYKPLLGQENLPKEKQILYRTMPHPQYEHAFLIVTYSPSRAKKDREDRECLIEKLRKKLNKPFEASVKSVISNSGYKKYTTAKKGSSIVLNEKAMKNDAAWDGFHGIAVSNSANISLEEALLRYRDLWHVEETFRIIKSTLKTRPIFHWISHRIKAHVLLCFLTLFFERFLELRLRQKGTPLTPDRLRYALSGIHTVIFENFGTSKTVKMPSLLSEDAKNIFAALEIPIQRETQMCCV